MNLKEILKQLEALGNERTRAHYTKQGAVGNQFGVKLGDIRKLAKKIGINQELALALWQTENIDARFLAILLIDLKALTVEQVDHMVRSIGFVRVADWFNSYVINRFPDKETLRKQWLNDDHPMAARSGWSLTAERVAKQPDGLDIQTIFESYRSRNGRRAA